MDGAGRGPWLAKRMQKLDHERKVLADLISKMQNRIHSGNSGRLTVDESRSARLSVSLDQASDTGTSRSGGKSNLNGPGALRSRPVSPSVRKSIGRLSPRGTHFLNTSRESEVSFARESPNFERDETMKESPTDHVGALPSGTKQTTWESGSGQQLVYSSPRKLQELGESFGDVASHQSSSTRKTPSRQGGSPVRVTGRKHVETKADSGLALPLPQESRTNQSSSTPLRRDQASNSPSKSSRPRTDASRVKRSGVHEEATHESNEPSMDQQSLGERCEDSEILANQSDQIVDERGQESDHINQADQSLYESQASFDSVEDEIPSDIGSPMVRSPVGSDRRLSYTQVAPMSQHIAPGREQLASVSQQLASGREQSADSRRSSNRQESPDRLEPSNKMLTNVSTSPNASLPRRSLVAPIVASESECPPVEDVKKNTTTRSSRNSTPHRMTHSADRASPVPTAQLTDNVPVDASNRRSASKRPSVSPGLEGEVFVNTPVVSPGYVLRTKEASLFEPHTNYDEFRFDPDRVEDSGVRARRSTVENLVDSYVSGHDTEDKCVLPRVSREILASLKSEILSLYEKERENYREGMRGPSDHISAPVLSPSGSQNRVGLASNSEFKAPKKGGILIEIDTSQFVSVPKNMPNKGAEWNSPIPSSMAQTKDSERVSPILGLPVPRRRTPTPFLVSNLKIILNALQAVCLAGEPNKWKLEAIKTSVFGMTSPRGLAPEGGKYSRYVILFKDKFSLAFVALYGAIVIQDKTVLNQVYSPVSGSCPAVIQSDQILQSYKYDTAGRTFVPIDKHCDLDNATDAVVIALKHVHKFSH